MTQVASSTLVAASSRHSIIVTLLEGTLKSYSGRNFTKSKNFLYIQTHFNNEILTTDPIKQTQNPIFDTELVWFVTHKQLSFFKSQSNLYDNLRAEIKAKGLLN
jgi:hypothetical protein